VALVLVADVGTEGGQLEAAAQARVDDAAVHRAALDVDVEDVEEGHHAAEASGADLRVLDHRDLGDVPVGRRDDDARRTVEAAGRVTEEEQDEETDRAQARAPARPAQREQHSAGEEEGKDERPGLLGESHRIGSASARSDRRAGPVLAQDPLHLVLESQLLELEPLDLDLVLRRRQRALREVRQPLLGGLVLRVEAAELVVGPEQFLLDEVELAHGRPSFR
jgi:hypothetical protein